MPIELHTDRLRNEVKADEIVCEVLRHDVEQRKRLVNIVSVSSGKRTVQTVAYTLLMPHMWTPEVSTVDLQLKHGSLMGETFRRHGFTVRQNRLLRIRMPLLNRAVARQFHAKLWRLSEVEVYEFWASNSLYGIVVEIKHPQRQQTPTRRSGGHHAALPHLGFTRAHLFQWLDGVRPMPSAWRLGLARIVGFLIGGYLYVLALLHGRYLEDETSG